MQPELTDHETLRYNRQIILQGFDFDKQEQLKAATVLIVGLGGLGCAASQYLAAAGVGRLLLLDFDTVSLSNLQRQTLHSDDRLDQFKVDSAKTRLHEINPHVQIETYPEQRDLPALAELVTRSDLVLDCTDNVPTRNQLNLVCHQQQKPLVSGAAIRMEGQVTVFTYQPGEPCYRCLSRLFGEMDLTCAERGVMAPLVGIIGTIQAMEVIKVLTHYGKPLTGRLLMVDAMTMQFQQIKLLKLPDCEICSSS